MTPWPRKREIGVARHDRNTASLACSHQTGFGTVLDRMSLHSSRVPSCLDYRPQALRPEIVPVLQRAGSRTALVERVLSEGYPRVACPAAQIPQVQPAVLRFSEARGSNRRDDSASSRRSRGMCVKPGNYDRPRHSGREDCEHDKYLRDRDRLLPRLRAARPGSRHG